MKRIKQKLTHQRLTEIAIGFLDHQHIAKVPSVAQHRQIIGCASFTLNLRRKAKPHLRLPNQVQRSVRKRDIFLDHRRMTAPFRDTMSKDQRVVAHAQQELKISRHYIAPTSSGISKKVGCR